MRRPILKYGLIGGTLMIALTFVLAALFKSGFVNIANGEYYGYAGMLIALTMVFFGIREYRSDQGHVTFWKAFQIGASITGIAAVMYFLGGELYNLIDPSFGPDTVAQYAAYQVDLLRSKGAAETEIEALRQQMSQFIEMYKNPLVRFGVALIEFVPVGIIVTVISALILRRPSREAAS